VTPFSTKHTADVRQRFSHGDAAGRWDAMYAAETENLEDANFRQRRDITVNYVLNLVDSGAEVLDLGCGAAPVLSELRRQGIHTRGLDASADMLENARSRLRALLLSDADLEQGDCRATPYASASFDVVICLGVISYIEDYDPVLNEIERLLKPGGTALISFRSAHNPIFSDPLRLGKHLLRKLLTPLLGDRPVPVFEIGRFLDHREVSAKMESRGFEFIDFFGIGFGPFRLAGRRLCSERQSIRLSNGLDKFCRGLAIKRPLRWLTDVSLWVYWKPGNT
jgi:ubiquinone/menaquinone biosynthesis C-methylase UbiE